MHEVGTRGWPLVKGHLLGGSWDPGLLGQILERVGTVTVDCFSYKPIILLMAGQSRRHSARPLLPGSPPRLPPASRRLSPGCLTRHGGPEGDPGLTPGCFLLLPPSALRATTIAATHFPSDLIEPIAFPCSGSTCGCHLLREKPESSLYGLVPLPHPHSLSCGHKASF